MWGGEPGAGGLSDPAGAHEQIAQWRQGFERMADNTKAMTDGLRNARVTVTDDNRLVEVTVDSSGRLVDLKLLERARTVSLDVVSRTIMQTIAIAAKQMGERARQIISETMGADSTVGHELAGRVVQQLRMPDPSVGGDGDRQRWR
jgi:DNA-binding protein YbaB